MIPGYKEEVKLPEAKQESNQSVEHKLTILESQVQQLVERVAYIDRERSRLKSEVESLRAQLNRR